MSLKTVNNSVKTSQSAMSEQDLLAKDSISPEDVLSLNKITDTYLCSPDANQFGIGKFISIYSILICTEELITFMCNLND